MTKKIIFDYDKTASFEQRQKEVETILLKHPDKIPIIIQQSATSKLQAPEKFKYLIKKEQTIGTFMYELRKRMNLKPEQALFIFINNIMPGTSVNLEEIYNNYKSEDGFLKIIFAEENTFG